MPKTHQMVSVTGLERSFRRPHVYFRIVGIVGLYRCLVNNPAGKTFLIKGALLWLTTIASPGPVVTIFTFTYTVIVPPNYSCHIRHATITDFNRISIKNLV